MEETDRLSNEDETDGGVNGFTLFISASISCCTIAPPVASWQFGAKKNRAVDVPVVSGERARLVWSQSPVPQRRNGLMDPSLQLNGLFRGLLSSSFPRLWPLNTSVFYRGQKVLGSRPASLGVMQSRQQPLLCLVRDGFT